MPCSAVSDAIANNRSTAKHNLIAVAILVLGAVLFSTKAIMVKLALPYGVDPVGLLLLRLSLAVPFYIAILIRVKMKADQPLQIRANAIPVALLGFVGYYLASYFDFVGLTYISASLERVILYSFPTMVLLISAVFLKKAIHLHQVVAIALCYGGIFIAVRFGDQQTVTEHQWFGVGMIFLSALAYAIYVVGSGQLIPKLGVWVFTSCAMIVSTVCIVVHHVLLQPSVALLEFPWQVYAYGLAMAILATVIPSFLISEGIKRIGASNASIIGGIGPISTIILATIILGERFTIAQAIGTSLVIAGVLYISLKAKRNAR